MTEAESREPLRLERLPPSARAAIERQGEEGYTARRLEHVARELTDRLRTAPQA